MMYKKVVLSLTLLLITQFVHGKPLEFIDANFDDFAKRLVLSEQELNEFKAYYSTLSKKMKECEEPKRKATYRYLYDLALSNMEKKHSDWYTEIKPFVSDPRYTLDEQLDDARNIIKFFLTRYGAYEEYLNLKTMVKEKEAANQVKVAESSGLWDSLKSYVSSASNKVAGWFGYGSSQVSA